mgnify:CR=1 FL=1
MTFGKEIKYVRSILYLTQAEMASRMSVTEQTIRRWEGGKGEPRPSAKRKLREICLKNKIDTKEGEEK